MASGSVFFAHGSGNRDAEAKDYAAQLEKGLKLAAGTVKRSRWGTLVGPDAKFPDLSKTMPTIPAAGFGDTNAEVLIDPYGPLRRLGGAQGAFGSTDNRDARAVLGFLALGSIDLPDASLPSRHIAAAAAEIVSSPEFGEANGDPVTLIDATVAGVAARAIQRQGPTAVPSGAFSFDPIGALKRELADRLTGAGTAAITFAGMKMSPAIMKWLSEQFAKQRPTLMQKHILVAADVLYYQRHAAKIRAHVRGEIEKLPRPRLVLGHSLGGIILVDTLFGPGAADLDVKLLVTFGSQSPLLQALGAFDDIKPTVPWLNIWTEFDFVSFLGAGLWAGKVTDQAISSDVGFPEAHGAYYTSDDFFAAIRNHPAAAQFVS